LALSRPQDITLLPYTNHNNHVQSLLDDHSHEKRSLQNFCFDLYCALRWCWLASGRTDRRTTFIRIHGTLRGSSYHITSHYRTDANYELVMDTAMACATNDFSIDGHLVECSTLLCSGRGRGCGGRQRGCFTLHTMCFGCRWGMRDGR
jgi:hypothetical protein